jgi:hypothetical protein
VLINQYQLNGSGILLSKMNLEQWCGIDEQIHIAESDEHYKLYAGLHYREELLERLAQMKLFNAQIFLNSFSQPRKLVSIALENIADSKTKTLELKLHRVRYKKIVSKKHTFGRKPVNWSTWRQFNNVKKNANNRKHVFDEFVRNTKYIAPIISDRFSMINEVYAEYFNNNRPRGNKKNSKLDPLSGYLENENISYSQLIKFVKSLGQQAKKPFREALRDSSKKILGREPDYYDDFYFFRNRVYADFEKYFSGIQPINELKKILHVLLFDASKIQFDYADRRNKYQSPICFFIQIPNDIRILFKGESPYFDLQSCFHETGHAIHAISIDPTIEYWNKYNIPMGIAEIFSIFLERLTKNHNYLKCIVRIKDVKLDEITRRNNFMELFFVTFYAANSLMKAEFWRKNLSIEQANDLYSKLIKEYTGFEIPGEYWMLHHILPEAIMYVPSYLLAAVRAKELNHYMQNKYGENWWREPESGHHLRDIMKPGAKIKLEHFSKLNSRMFIKEITNI